jgi:hypothetical protein
MPCTNQPRPQREDDPVGNHYDEPGNDGGDRPCVVGDKVSVLARYNMDAVPGIWWAGFVLALLCGLFLWDRMRFAERYNKTRALRNKMNEVPADPPGDPAPGEADPPGDPVPGDPGGGSLALAVEAWSEGLQAGLKRLLARAETWWKTVEWDLP